MRPSHIQSADISSSSPARAPQTGTATREFRLFNTLTRQTEAFAPADGETVRIYSCGPTVYNPAHLGNFRTFLFVDLMRRTLELRGWKVRQVMNLTDVDDKIIRRAHEQRKTIREVTEPVTAIFHKDREYLRIQAAEVYPKATDYIPQMIRARRAAHRARRRVPGGRSARSISRSTGSPRTAACRVSTSVSSRPAHASRRMTTRRRTRRTSRCGRRRRPNDEVTGAAWDSPWGRGRPGWHLECSAMAIDLLGETLDIHCGGIDLVFPHHEDEIAQSEAATGQTFSRFWCHGAFLLTDGAKMAKRLGNVTTVQGMREADVSPAALRHFVFNTHYRKELNLSDEALEASINAVRRIGDFADRLGGGDGGTPELAAAADDGRCGGRGRAFDDLNAPKALAGLFTLHPSGERRARSARVGRRGA